MEPVVSIIIPTYNRAHLLGETLNSVLQQTYKNWECLVVDDGSSDQTEELVQIFSKKNPGFKYFKRSPRTIKGAASCRNIGIEKAVGDFFQFLDSDDLISPGKIEGQVHLLQEKNCSITTCKWGRFTTNQNDAEVYENFSSYSNFESPLHFFNSLPSSLNFFPVHAYLFRKEVVMKAGYWNEYLHFNEDAEFVVRVLCNTEKICFSEKGIAYYRLPGELNVSSYNDRRKVVQGIMSWKLIEAYTRVRFGEETISYVKKGKAEFFNHIKDYPEIIQEHKAFFSSQLGHSSSKKRFLERFFIKKN